MHNPRMTLVRGRVVVACSCGQMMGKCERSEASHVFAEHKPIKPRIVRTFQPWELPHPSMYRALEEHFSGALSIVVP